MLTTTVYQENSSVIDTMTVSITVMNGDVVSVFISLTSQGVLSIRMSNGLLK